MVKATQRPGRAVACSTGQTQLGEGVRWDARRNELLAVDILAGGSPEAGSVTTT